MVCMMSRDDHFGKLETLKKLQKNFMQPHLNLESFPGLTVYYSSGQYANQTISPSSPFKTVLAFHIYNAHIACNEDKRLQKLFVALMKILFEGGTKRLE